MEIHVLLANLSFAAVVMLATGCIKDGILPTKPLAEGSVLLKVDVVNGVHPFAPAMWSEDGSDTRVQFNTLKFYLSGINLLDTYGNRIEGLSRTELLLDASGSRYLEPLGTIPNGHIQEFRFTLGLDRVFSCEEAYPHGHPYIDPAMPDLEDLGRSHLIMVGYVDVNENGAFDAVVDSEFNHRSVGGQFDLCATSTCMPT